MTVHNNNNNNHSVDTSTPHHPPPRTCTHLRGSLSLLGSSAQRPQTHRPPLGAHLLLHAIQKLQGEHLKEFQRDRVTYGRAEGVRRTARARKGLVRNGRPKVAAARALETAATPTRAVGSRCRPQSRKQRVPSLMPM